MDTKFPVSGNRVVGWWSRRDRPLPRRRRRQRGIALIAVVAVLVLLTIVATPFLLTQRDSAARGERYLYEARATMEAESLFEMVRSHLTVSLEHLERTQLDQLGSGGDAEASAEARLRATPSSDTLAEFQLPAEVLARFNRVSAKNQRIWDVEVIDQQARFNLNDCSYPVLANILGRSRLVEALSVDDESRILVDDASMFPEENGLVRIGNEVIRYETRMGNELVGLERGYKSEEPANGSIGEWEAGDIVIDEAAFQLAIRPFRADPDRFVRYTNVYQAREISALGLTALQPAEFDKLRRYVTPWNGNVVGDGWTNPQLVRNNLSANDATQLYVRMKNPAYYGMGTVVRISDGVNSDYGIVTKVRGANEVLIAGEIRHDYEADQTKIYSLARSPINVNTAEPEILKLVFWGLRLRGKSSEVDEQTAEELAYFLQDWVAPQSDEFARERTPEVGVFRNWEDLVTALESASDQGILDDDQLNAVVRNAMNANDYRLAFSTVPFVFRSFDVYEVRATASILGIGGKELARREIRRVFEAATSRSGTYVVETQDDFQRQIMKSRDGKYWTSYPDNVNGYYDGSNVPASEFFAFRQQSRFPDRDRSRAVGHVALLPGATRYVGRPDRFQHFDIQDDPDGLELEDSPYSYVVAEDYSVQDQRVDLIETDEIAPLGTELELGIQTFAGQFWYRPRWTRDGNDRVLFDYSVGEDFQNRVRLSYDGDRDLLVLAVADATDEDVEAEVFYDFAFTEWDADQWYHIAFSVNGAAPGLNQLFIDGEQVGLASHITRLTQSVPTTGNLQQLNVEDASTFPDTGVLLVHGSNGMELMEYDSVTDNSFNIIRRKARSIDVADDEDEPRAHDPGDIVELYGFAGPLLTDAVMGGATLQGQIGPQRVYRLNYATESEENADAIRSSGGAPQAIDGDLLTIQDPADPARFIAVAAGLGNPANPQLPIQGITLTEWDTGDDTESIIDDIGTEGTRGIALIVSQTVTLDNNTNSITETIIAPNSVSPAGEQQAAEIGGAEIVTYTVTGVGEVQLDARNVDLTHVGSTPGDNGFGRFFSTYNYRDEGEPGFVGTTNENTDGVYTAFIPIAILAEGNGDNYLNPVDEETQLGGVGNRFAYLQIDGEWVKYDTLDTDTVAGFVAFYRDQALIDVANLFGSGDKLEEFEVQENPSTAPAGGQFDIPADAVVPPAQSINTGDNLPEDPRNNSNTPYIAPPENVRTAQILDALDFRGYVNTNDDVDQRVANTDPDDHDAGAEVIPAFLLAPGNDVTTFGPEADAARGAFPGFNDLITLRDRDFKNEQFRARWGYRGWVAPDSALRQNWNRDIPQEGFQIDLRQYDSRAFVRALKFPSAELPDSELTINSERLTIGGTDDGSIALAPATLDEVVFWELNRPGADRPSFVLLGTVPEGATANAGTGGSTGPGGAVELPEFLGIDDQASTIPVHMPYFDAGSQALFASGLPIDPNLFADDGGCILINDELIYYEDFDPQSGEFFGCQRGVMGTEPDVHSFGSRIVPIHAFPFSRLVSDADTSSAEFELTDARDFPDDGYLRIADLGEIVGYTELQGNSLSGPLGRIDPTTLRDPEDAEARVGGGLFRGRFGTEPAAYRSGDIVMGMPFRHYDRFAERADHPEQSYVQLSWRKEGAIWKRVTWDEQPIENADLLALVRFSGGPEWDSDRIIRVGQERMPAKDRRKYLYEIADPLAENLLNVESDRIEVRLHVRFASGAYDRFADVAPNAWKETPWVKKVVVEFVAPPTVLSQE